MRHLARHTRPLRHVDGIKVCYGNQTTQDFDLHFTRRDIQPNPLGDISAKIANLPTGRAIVTDRPKPGKNIPKDPEGRPILQFAIGAYIVGITFPERFNGQWCLSYHDDKHAMFPLNTIHLIAPSRDVVMDSKSPLVATARWDHKPKDT
jgi:hypothetical protein